MKANKLFLNQPKHFWANVRSISQHLGYTERRTDRVKVPTIEEMQTALREIGLSSTHLFTARKRVTTLGHKLGDYFAYRADVLNNHVRPRLMTVTQAQEIFAQLKAKHHLQCPLPLNKQKGEKKAEAYLTCIVNILIEAYAEGLPCDYDPRELTAVTRNRQPLRTLARRVDGAFPSTVNPIAVWEIKEYYYTTTFGSRVADGVYETLLDGLELEELREHEKIDIEHYLIVDDYNT